MTLKQRIFKFSYPLFSFFKRSVKRQKIFANELGIRPLVPFDTLTTHLIDGKIISFRDLKGKKVLLVNTASDCGYTAQYGELQKLYRRLHSKLEIIAFPSNNFKEQEKGSNEQILKFCSENYNVTFPVAKKTQVKGPGQDEVFRWLTVKELNGWNDVAPSWNFCKYVVNEEGTLTHVFHSSVSPLSAEVLGAL